MRSIRRNFRLGLLAVLAAVVVLIGTGRGDAISELDRLTASYKQDLVRWEVTHVLDKWWHRAVTSASFGTPAPAEIAGAIEQFFALGEQMRGAERALERTLSAPPEQRTQAPEEAAASIDDLEGRRRELQGTVEEALEAAISKAAAELGVINKLGPLRWPPVDFAFERSALVLVRSPRDEVRRLEDVLLRPDVPLLGQEHLEERVEAVDSDVTALVGRVGGVATYPTQVTPDAPLHGTLVLASHEWLHHWLFFRPLGRAWYAGGEMASINETVANIAGREIGDRALTLLTGEAVDRPPYQPPTLEPREAPPPGVFDFRREMQRTRLRLDALLGDGRVDEAEAYLEVRRLEFVANGLAIRKLNTAYFAFHGIYADSFASVSTIEPQLQAVHADSANLAEFLDRIAQVSKPGGLRAMAIQAGWEPPAP